MAGETIHYGPFPVRWDLVWAAVGAAALALGAVWWVVDGESLRCRRQDGAGLCVVRHDGLLTSPQVTRRFRVRDVQSVRFRTWWPAGKGGERGETILTLHGGQEVRFGRGPESDARERFDRIRNFFATREDASLQADEAIGWTFWPLVIGLLAVAAVLLAWVAWARLRRDLLVLDDGRALRVTIRLLGVPIWRRELSLAGVEGVVVDRAHPRHLGEGRALPVPWAARVTLRFHEDEMRPIVRALHRDLAGAVKVAKELQRTLGLPGQPHEARGTPKKPEEGRPPSR